MHKNCTVFAAGLLAFALAFGGPATAAEEEVGGGKEATADDMASICDGQADMLKLSGDDRSGYLDKCNKTSIETVQRSARKMEGQK